MNEILGILIPMLMSGASIGDIFRALGGDIGGAPRMDGLAAMLSASTSRAATSFPARQTDNRINTAAELLANRMGINPYSGGGQGFVSLLTSSYRMFPDLMSGVLGLPNGQQFFSTIANGASGIGMAAGFGQTDIFNPYSVMANHRRTVGMAQTAYDLGTGPEGGYRIDFSHGLNMSEMGKVTQRLLSSSIPYREYRDVESGNFNETGRSLNLDNDEDAEKFKGNLKKLGSKFNEAASMLAKVTGSVEEALHVMDRLGGGNFLGGTAEQASKVASQAKRMAAAIRVTSAIAGVSPTEAYSNMKNLGQIMATGMGVSSPYIAEASGFADLNSHIAYSATMGYNTWLAMNPNASPTEKRRALLAVNGRAQAYSSSNSAAFAAMVAANANVFSADEKRQIESALRSGRPDDVKELVRTRIGGSRYTAYMTDEATQVAARNDAMRNNPELMKNLDQANLEGGLSQVEAFGARRWLNKTLADTDSALARRTGGGAYSKEREESVKAAFVKLAVEQGMQEDAAKGMKTNDLRRFLQESPGVDNAELARVENRAMVDAAKKQIDDATMTTYEEYQAGQRLKQEVLGSKKWNDDKRQEMARRIDEDGIDAVVKEFSSNMTWEERRDLDKRIFNGKITLKEGERLKKGFEKVEKSQAEYSSQERMDAIERDYRRSDLENMGSIKTELASEKFSKLGPLEAMERFRDRAKELEEKGVLSTGGDKDLKGTYQEAATRLVASVFGDKLGNMKGKDLNDFVSRVASRMVEGMRGGKPVNEAFAEALSENKLTEKEKEAIGWGKDADGKTRAGQAAVEDFAKRARESQLKNLDLLSFFSASSGALEENQTKAKSGYVKEMRELLEGKFGDKGEKGAFGRFKELAKKVGGYDVSDEEFEKLAKEEARAIKDDDKGSGVRAMSNFLGKIKPAGKRDDSFFAISGTGGAERAAVLMAVTNFKMAGGDVKKLNLGKEWEDLLSGIDDDKAGRSMNAVSNMLHVGGMSFQKDAIASAEKQALRLGTMLKGGSVSLDVAREAFGNGEGAAQAKRNLIAQLEKAGSADAKSDASMIGALLEKKIGGKSAVEVMMGGERVLEDAKKSLGKDYDEQMVGVVRESARKDSPEYEIMKSIGDFARTIKPFIDNPAALFQDNPLPVKVWGPVNLGYGATY